LEIHPLESVGLVVLTVLLFSAIDGFGGLGLSGKGLVALTLGLLFSTGRSSSSATTAVATMRPIRRPRAKHAGVVFP